MCSNLFALGILILIIQIQCFYFRPKHKYIRITKDEHFKTEEHQLSLLPLKAEKSCSYDMDDVDSAWLKLCNGERSLGGNTSKCYSHVH